MASGTVAAERGWGVGLRVYDISRIYVMHAAAVAETWRACSSGLCAAADMQAVLKHDMAVALLIKAAGCNTFLPLHARAAAHCMALTMPDLMCSS